jgi:putative hemolysin
VTEDELKSMVDAGHEGGVLEQEERQMIYSIFDLGDTLAREIMVPRIYVTALDISVPLTEAIGTLVQSGHSRVPVYEDSIDKIKGLLYAKDLLRVWRDGGEIASVRSLLRPAYLVPEAKKVKDMLAEMQAGRVHMAIVVDEYGGVAGLVTMEDIVEEIVGEIRDEYDQSEELPFVQVGDGEYLFQGRIDLERVNEMMSSHLPTDESETLGGYIYGQVGRVPVNGEILRVDNLLLTVEQVSGHRIRKVRAKKVSSDQEVIQDDDKTDQ